LLAVLRAMPTTSLPVSPALRTPPRSIEPMVLSGALVVSVSAAASRVFSSGPGLAVRVSDFVWASGREGEGLSRSAIVASFE
jgi:hypothetical protein